MKSNRAEIDEQEETIETDALTIEKSLGDESSSLLFNDEESSNPESPPETTRIRQQDRCISGILSIKTEEESLSNIFGKHSAERQKQNSCRIDKDGNVVNVDDLSVSFSDLTILEFPVTVGDNPSSFRGPSLTIDWKTQSKQTVSLEDYEDMRPPRRCGREMVIPEQGRLDMLRQAGFARNEIIALTRPVNISRAQRKKTNATLAFSPLHEWTERVSRRTRNILSLGGRKRRERQLLKPYYNSAATASASASNLRRVSDSTVAARTAANQSSTISICTV